MLCLGSESKCDVCLDQFGLAEKIPTCIPCGHIFCHECFDQLPRQKCPLCQEQFNPGSKVKLYVDIEPAEVQRLHSTVLCFADNGASEAQLRDALVDFKAFLKKHPRPQFQNLRAASKMLQYILMLKSRTIELEARSDKLDYKKGSLVDRIEELKSELAGLKEENRSLEEEKRSLERDYEKAEKQNLASLRTHVDAHTFLMQKYENVVKEWQTLREELRRVQGRTSIPQGESSPVVESILAKETPDDGFGDPVDHYPPVILSDTQYIISPLADFTGQQLPKALPEIVDAPLAEKLVRLHILNPCGSAMHPYNCSCHSDSRPSGKARSGSLSSFTQSSPSSGSSDASSNLYPQPEDLPSQTSAPLGGLSLSAPKPDTPLHIPMSPPVGSSSSPPKERKRTKHKARRPSDSAPLPPSSSGIAQASVNADTAGGTSDAESVVRGQRQLRSRLADLLTDPTNTPSPDASVSFSMPNMAGSYFPPQATAAREYDSLRRKDSSSRRARSPTMPQQSKPGLVQQATAPSRLEQSYDVTHTVSSLPRPGISVASDAARKVLKEKQKTEKQSTASGATTTSGGRQRAYSGEVSYKGSSSSAAWASSTRQGTASPMPIPSGINAGSMRWDGQ